MTIRDKAAIHYGNDCLKSPYPRHIPWIWDGVVAENAITLLSGPEKAGKTTLLSLLLDRRRAGARCWAGRCDAGGLFCIMLDSVFS
jgi:hypothetical protein